MADDLTQDQVTRPADEQTFSSVPHPHLDPARRVYIIAAALLALFLGALDSLIVSAAMPTIVAELGSMHLYSWVYSVYFLSRAVSMPIFGKLADLYHTRTLFIVSIALFIIASVLAGLSPNMTFLIVSRAFQGVGAGGNFALIYIALSDVAAPENRAKTLSLASSSWGIASILGPTLGGFIVTYFSWRWIFFINVPLGLLSLAGIALYLIETRAKKEKVYLDFPGVVLLSAFILSLLTVFLLGGRTYEWVSIPIISLATICVVSAAGFYYVEKRAAEPILSLGFFEIKGFRIGNSAGFFCSFTIFALFAFAPLYIQGALRKSPMMVGIGMLSLSLGWSLGSLVLGQILNLLGHRVAGLLGAVWLALGCGVCLFFTTQTSMLTIFLTFVGVGLGMGFVTLTTLVVVQNSVDIADLGVATTSHQFSRTMGGAVGIGICGSFVTSKIAQATDAVFHSGLAESIPQSLLSTLKTNIENLLLPEVQALLSPEVQTILRQAIVSGVVMVFWIVLASSLLCLGLCLRLPGKKGARS